MKLLRYTLVLKIRILVKVLSTTIKYVTGGAVFTTNKFTKQIKCLAECPETYTAKFHLNLQLKWHW